MTGSLNYFVNRELSSNLGVIMIDNANNFSCSYEYDRYSVWIPTAFHKFLSDKDIPCGRLQCIVGSISLVECTIQELRVIHQCVHECITGISSVFITEPLVDENLIKEASRTKSLIAKHIYDIKQFWDQENDHKNKE